MFVFLMWSCLAVTVIGGIVGQIKEKDMPDGKGAWFGWGLAVGLIAALISVIVSLIVGLFVWANDLGTDHVTGSTTYKVAENSRLEMDGRHLEFTYVDNTGHLTEFDKYSVDSIKIEGKGQTVEVIDYQIVASGILPWDIISEGTKAVVK